MSRSSTLLALLFFVSSLFALGSPETALRKRPISFVSDPSNWLPRETRESLESFLSSRSNDLDAEVYVLLEPLPSRSLDQTREHLEELGDSWSTKNWAVIAYNPGQIGAPVIVSGQSLHSEINPNFWKNDLLLLQQISLQSWDQHADIDSLARELSDSICFFSRARDATTEVLAQNWKQQEDTKRQVLKSQKELLTSIAVASLLALIAGTFLFRKIYLAHRKMYFPTTTYPQRLGAPHSGGSAVNQHFQPPQA